MMKAEDIVKPRDEKLVDAFAKLPKSEQLQTIVTGQRLLEIMDTLPSKKGFLLLRLAKKDICIQAFSGDDTSMEFLRNQHQANTLNQLRYIG